MASETDEKRKFWVRELKKQAADYRASEARKWERTIGQATKAVDTLVVILLDKGASPALALTDDYLSRPEYVSRQDEFERMRFALLPCVELEKKILNVYRRQRGKVMEIELISGRVKAQIIEVHDDDRVEAEELLSIAGATRPFYFTLNDLSPRERTRLRRPSSLADRRFQNQNGAAPKFPQRRGSL